MVGSLAEELCEGQSQSLKLLAIVSLKAHRVNEVTSSEGTSDERGAGAGGTLDGTSVSNMAEDLGVAKTTKRQLAPVGVGGEVFDSVEERAEETVGLVEIGLASTVSSTTTCIDALVDTLTHETSGGVPCTVLVGDVVLGAASGKLRASLTRTIGLAFMPVRGSTSSSLGSTGGRRRGSHLRASPPG